MAWQIPVFDEFEKIIDGIVEEAIDLEDEGVEDGILVAMDNTMIYNVDLLGAIQYYGLTAELFAQHVWEVMYEDVLEQVYAKRGDDEE